jgi:hypothetical protein
MYSHTAVVMKQNESSFLGGVGVGLGAGFGVGFGTGLGVGGVYTGLAGAGEGRGAGEAFFDLPRHSLHRFGIAMPLALKYSTSPLVIVNI